MKRLTLLISSRISLPDRIGTKPKDTIRIGGMVIVKKKTNGSKDKGVKVQRDYSPKNYAT